MVGVVCFIDRYVWSVVKGCLPVEPFFELTLCKCVSESVSFVICNELCYTIRYVLEVSVVT